MEEQTIRDMARSLCQAYERGSVEGVLALMAPGVVTEPPALLAHEPYEGHAGIRRAFAEIERDWDVLRFETHRIGASGDRAVLLCRYRAGRDGAVRDGRVAWVIDVAGGLILHLVAHPSWESALAAAGLDLAATETVTA